MVRAATSERWATLLKRIWLTGIILATLAVGSSGGEEEVATLEPELAFSLSCPKECQCKWRKGKETVACRNAGYTEIPELTDPGTQVKFSKKYVIATLRCTLYFK